MTPYTSVSTMHRCIAIRFVSRYTLPESRSCNIFAFFLFECPTDINCQSAKNYQCHMSSHPQQTTGSTCELKTIKLCPMSPSRHQQQMELLVVVNVPSSLDTSRHQDSNKLNWPLIRIPFSHPQPKSRGSPGSTFNPFLPV